MFTGLIELQGKVCANNPSGHGNRLIISTNCEPLQVGESIAVNGVCLTLVSKDNSSTLHFDVSPETLRATSLGALALGDGVNLEQSMMAATRMGGHYVSGHVDSTALVQSIYALGEYREVELTGFDQHSMHYLVPKGSITVEGVSLTINSVDHSCIRFMLVPHTLAHTTLGLLQVGQRLNIEFDYLARIVAHQLQLSGRLKPEVATC